MSKKLLSTSPGRAGAVREITPQLACVPSTAASISLPSLNKITSSNEPIHCGSISRLCDQSIKTMSSDVNSTYNKFMVASAGYKAVKRYYNHTGKNVTYLNKRIEVASIRNNNIEIDGKKGAVMTCVKINGIQYKALIDSGADRSMISAEFARRIRSEYRPNTNDTYITAGKSTLNVVGEAQISFSLVDNVLEEYFLVADVLAYDIIIGADILWKNKIDILFSDGTARLGENYVRIAAKTNRSVCSVAETSSMPSQLAQIDDTNLNPSQRKQLVKLLDEYEDIFSKNEDDIGKSEFIHKITLNSETPVKSRAYRTPFAQKQCVEKEIAKMLRMGVIVKSHSDYCSPIVLVKKRDMTNRFCVDFRKLNAITVKDCYPMPFIDEKLESLRGKNFFSSLDLTAGYWQFLVDPASRRFTAFISHLGIFEFIRMPFGLCNAGATFQRSMEEMLQGVDNSTAYIDDILTSSCKFDDHLKDLTEVFEILRKKKLKMKPSKCSFGMKETKFLGFIVSNKGIKVCDSRSESIKNYPTPKNAKNIKQFLGLASYYRKFIRNFSELAAPLNKLTHKDVKFLWSMECENAFRNIINCLLNPPILAFPDYSKRFKLTTDASNIGLGAVLSQNDENGDEKVVAYASRTLQCAEKNYSTTEQELLAIMWAVEKFRPYLFDVEFDLETDHKPLTYLRDLNMSSSRLTRWKLKLAEYSYIVKYKPGKDNVVADALSRLDEDRHHTSFSINTVTSDEKEFDLGETINDDIIKELQDADPEIAKLKHRVELRGGEFNNLLLENNILFCKRRKKKSYEPHGMKRLVVPTDLREMVLLACHDELGGAHLGLNKTWAKVVSRFYWPGIKEDVTNWIESCSVCAARKPPKSTREVLHPITHPKIPFEQIGIDFLGPLPLTENGNKYVLVITDYATRWVEAFATSDMKADTVAKILIDEVICRHSAPHTILSDQGRSFLSNVVQEMCKYFKINKINTTPYHPQCNGLTERFNKTLCQMLSTYCNDNQTNWDIYLPITLFAYRTSVQKTTQEMPFRSLYAYNPRLPSDIDKYSPNALFIDKIDEAWKQANELIELQGEKSAKNLAEKYPTQGRYEINDSIRLEQPATKSGLKKKLRKDLWQGPYKVTNTNEKGNVEVDIRGKKKWIHVNRVKPAEKSRYGRIYRKVERYGINPTDTN